jgi:hypothetical protein
MAMIVSQIKLYELLKARLGEKEAEAFVEILEEKVESKFADKQTALATKEDLLNLKTELHRTTYLTSFGQHVAIIASVIALILTLKK